MSSINGLSAGEEQSDFLRQPTSYFCPYQHPGSTGAPSSANGNTDHVPPPDAYNDAEYMSKITVPLNNVLAFTPKRKLRLVTIGAGYAGMTLAHKIQHQYAEEMSNLVDRTIYEAKDAVGGPWITNTCGNAVGLFDLS